MRNFCAGIVTFNPDLERLDANINAIKDSVERIIIIDNNSENKDFINRYDNNDDFIVCINSENRGIAAALNQICSISIDEGFEWVLLLDQDSVCGPNLLKVYSDYLSDPDLALLTPYIIDINKLTIEKYKNLDLPPFESVDWAITSGSLIKLDVWKRIGGFLEELFIDAVDIDYSIRLKINGYKQYRINNVYLLQEVGKAEPTWIFRPHKDNSGKWSIKRYYRSNHSLVRQYYMTRNNIIIARMYSNYKSVYKGIIFTLIMTLPKFFVEKNKINLVRTVVKGFVDGFKFKVIRYVK